MVDWLMSVNVNVALRAVSVILHQPIASQVKRVENLGHVGDRDQNNVITHCSKK